MNRFAGRGVLVTGGTSGIGRATALAFAAEGAAVTITGRRAELGRTFVDQVQAAGGRALYVPADHRRAEDCRHAVETVLAEFGRIDVLFNNAGIVVSGTAESTSEQDWQDTLDLNVTAVWRMCRLVLPVMRAQGGGAIVNNASDWGLVGAADALAYAVSKGAVVQMTRCLALDHARENIRVNAVCPGDTFVERWVRDGFFRGAGPLEDLEQQLAADGDALPLGRIGRVDEIARAVLFLASDEASFITGAALPVDGGNTAR